MKGILFFSTIILIACQTNRNSTITEKSISEKVTRIAFEKYGDRYSLKPSETNNYILVVNKTKKFSELGYDVNFFIYDKQKQIILFEDFLKSGHIEWHSNTSVKAVNRKIDTSKKGKRNKEIYIYNVLTNTKEFL